jgi:hypothetical protein
MALEIHHWHTGVLIVKPDSDGDIRIWRGERWMYLYCLNGAVLLHDDFSGDWI